MATALIEDAGPSAWSIERLGGEGPVRDVLHFGRYRIAVDDIVAVDGETDRRRPAEGLFVAAALFFLAAAAIAFGVFEIGWRTKYLLGTVFLAFLGAAGFVEQFSVHHQQIFRLRLRLKSGEVVTFASADLGDVRSLMDRLSR
jgi:hypothetical protein